MGRRRIVPITRATGFGPLPQMLADSLGEHALQHTFNKHGLGLAAAEQDDLYLPHSAMLGIFEHAAKRIGSRHFGLRVGQAMEVQSYGLWAEYCASADTLREAIERLCSVVRFQHSRNTVRLEYDGDFAILRIYPVDLGLPMTQHSDHLLYPLLHLVQRFLGPRWRPDWFELNYPRDSEADEIEARLPSPVRFGLRSVGIALPSDLLSAERIMDHRIVSLATVEENDPIQHFREPLRSITVLAILRLMDGRTDIEGTAELAGVSARTLQRHLREEGLSYRELLEMIRSTRAKELLVQQELSITQIALALGYSEHANFTRAFTRWTGQSPLEYRLKHRVR